MSYLSNEQYDRLIAPINPTRVLDLKGMSYVAQHDIRAHMNRIFGFGRWSTRVVETVMLFEEQNEQKRWKVGYRATVEVSIDAPDGTFLASYQDSHASGNMPQPDRAEAHALALTSAVSTAIKRACSNLGDQFGLSLYNKGQKSAFVMGTIVRPDMAAGVVQEAPVNDLGDEAHSKDEATYNPPREEISRTNPKAVSQTETDDLPLTVDHEMWLSELRAVASNSKARERVLVVASLKSAATGTDILTMMTEVPGHGNITYGQLADLVAAGSFAKEDQA
jgi:hypothetical protein